MLLLAKIPREAGLTAQVTQRETESVVGWLGKKRGREVGRKEEGVEFLKSLFFKSSYLAMPEAIHIHSLIFLITGAKKFPFMFMLVWTAVPLIWNSCLFA